MLRIGKRELLVLLLGLALGGGAVAVAKAKAIAAAPMDHERMSLHTQHGAKSGYGWFFDGHATRGNKLLDGQVGGELSGDLAAACMPCVNAGRVAWQKKLGL
jgi:hypothetical protein